MCKLVVKTPIRVVSHIYSVHINGTEIHVTWHVKGFRVCLPNQLIQRSRVVHNHIIYVRDTPHCLASELGA